MRILRRLRAAGVGWSEDQASQMGAALAYYTLFSLAPLLVVGMLVLGIIVGEAETKEHVLSQVRSFLDSQAADTVQGMLDHFRNSRGKIGSSLVGLASLLFGTTGMFTSLRSSLHRIWRLQPADEGLVTSYVKTYLLSFMMVLVSCIFLLVMLLLSTLLPLIIERGSDVFPYAGWSASILQLLVSTLLLTLLFAFTFRFLSDGRLRYRQLWSGALVSAFLFSVGKMLIGYYLAYVNLASAYGAAGSVVFFLAWVYYSAQIIFYGAEVIRCGLPR